MNSRERVLRTINHKTPDRIPLDGWFDSKLWAKLKSNYNISEDENLRQLLGIDFRYIIMEPKTDFRKNSEFLNIIGKGIAISEYFVKKVDENIFEDEWGVRIKVNKDNWSYSYHPLSSGYSLNNLKIPDLDSGNRFETAEKEIKKWKHNYFIYTAVSTLFRKGWVLTGFTKFLELLLLDRPYIERLLDILLEHTLKEVKMCAQAGVDMIEFLGDLGTEISLFIKPSLWREIFKPRMATIIKSIKKNNLYFFLHSDGNIQEIIPDLIEIGIDILNPIQPECMDPIEIKKKYGDDLTLHGTMSLQKTFTFGSAKDVISEAKSRIENCGYNGGLILAPSNLFTSDVSIENITTFYDFVQNYKLK